MGQPNVEEVVRGYIKLRDKKNEIKTRHTEELKPINEKMALLEAWLLRDLTERKVQSQKTEEGTAYLSTASSATVFDRDEFLKFVIENKLWDMLENRVSKSAVEDYLENKQQAVPGVKYDSVKVVRIRR